MLTCENRDVTVRDYSRSGRLMALASDRSHLARLPVDHRPANTTDSRPALAVDLLDEAFPFAPSLLMSHTINGRLLQELPSEQSRRCQPNRDEDHPFSSAMELHFGEVDIR